VKGNVGGVGNTAGPGGILAELLLEYGGIDHTATESSNTGALSFGLGYRFIF
jgi:hypothetical protein